MSSDSPKMLQEEFEASNNVSWAEEAVPTPIPLALPGTGFTKLDVRTDMDAHGNNETSTSQPVKKIEALELIEAPENQRSAAAPPRRVIPFDYDEFCADIPESMQPYFQACSKQLKTSNLNTNSELASPVKYLEVPKLVYGRRIKPIENGKSTIRRLNFNGCSGSESDMSDEESMKANEKNNNGLEMKKPLALQRKKIRPQMLPPPPPEPETNQNSSCVIM